MGRAADAFIEGCGSLQIRQVGWEDWNRLGEWGGHRVSGKQEMREEGGLC